LKGIDRKEKYLSFTHRVLAYQIVVNHNQLEGKGFPIFEKTQIKTSNVSGKIHKEYI